MGWVFPTNGRLRKGGRLCGGSILDVICAIDEERATDGCPYIIRVKFVRIDNVQITCEYALICDMLAFVRVGATSGRPLFIYRIDKTKTLRRPCGNLCK